VSDSEGAGREPARRKVYGRRKGKTLRPAQIRLLEDVLPRLRIPGIARTGERGRAPVDTLALFGDARPLWLEIGSGGGEHAVHQARTHPEIGLLTCEPFVNGVAMLLAGLEAEGLGNVRIHPGDARDLIELLPAGALWRVFLLYPDPWPKTRHHQRRFANPENIALLHRAMAPGAELRLASDIPGYVAHALSAFAASPGFSPAPGAAPDWSMPWPDWPGTRYEAKALRQGRRGHYLTFVRD
jgi:tRNA (guanine-N7-)-methyltransferase